ncbi:LacI family DNA-binding transcriptional regulator [Streptacidiphilus carbonis]|jgi:LacI family transcriptional regulator|uniref:LacI family DNA-binding transcriptional regulator n=1 Tax=Streptacidiphilus carbonis TaxID=105422 RepID=UPI0005AA3393|nr:LacI family DNA-binding transcriptional regulator [Streptacidiphilus carbonis]
MSTHYGARPTMNDVAKRAGVAPKTVSRVVNGEPGVSEATLARVRAAIAELGFRRNDGARSLRSGRTASIGLLLEDIADPFSSQLNRAVEEAARSRGCLVLAGSSAEDPVRERELALTFCSRRVDGLIVVPAGDDHRYLLPELTAGLAAVFVDRPARRIEADAVLTDNVGGAREGAAHLIRHGHRRIGFLGDLPHIPTAAERLRGYREAMTGAGLPVSPEWIVMGSTGPAEVGAAVERLTSAQVGVTAVLAGNNRITVGVLRALSAQDRGRIAVVGFDDLELADLLSPGLTVVVQDPEALGRAAAELLFGRLAGDRRPPRELRFRTRLVARGSGEIRPGTACG